MVNELIESCAKVGLQINTGKTRYMCNCAPQKMYIGCNEVERVSEYVYLEQNGERTKS